MPDKSHLKKSLIWIPGILAALIVAAIVTSFFTDEPLRRYMEGTINNTLKEYTVRINKLSFHPVGFSLDLDGFILAQKANPDPPVLDIRRVHASLHWGALLRGRLVGDFEMEQPKIHINLKHFKSEAARQYPVKKENWQEVAKTIYPMKINEFRINNGEFTYLDKEPSRPLRLGAIELVARNILNIRVPDQAYPSEIRFQAVLFDTGKIEMTGKANFLLEPFIGINVDAGLEGMDLAYFKPIAERHGFSIKKGTASAAGHVEYAPMRRIFKLKNLTIKGAEADYIHRPVAAGAAKRAAEKATETAKELANKPETLVKAEKIEIIRSEFGVVNKAASPAYRVYVQDLDLEIANFSNHFTEGPAKMSLNGKFMGSGDTTMQGTFRPEKNGPDFNLKIAIQNTKMTAMNDLFRAYGNFDVSEGLFSFFSELDVRDKKINGYVKPLFQDLKVYDKRTDEEKSGFRKLYEKIIGGIINLFENPREEVATMTPISGRIENPEASSWEVIINLIQNAFFRAILPGFEENIT